MSVEALGGYQVFYDKNKFYILRQNLHQTCFNYFSNVKWCMIQTSSTCLCGLSGQAFNLRASHGQCCEFNSQQEGNFLLNLFKPPDVNLDLKCKCDIIVKNLTG